MQYMNETKQINRNHFAYRKNHSTISAMIQLADRIYSATDSKLITTLITIDESAAFDSVSHEILLKKFKMYNFSTQAQNWFNSYISLRSQYVTINSKHSVISKVTTGVPQGSVLGPLMYMIYINELPDATKDPTNCNDKSHNQNEELFGENCSICGEIPCFADDATVVFSSRSRQRNQQKMIEHLDTVTNFLNDNKLTVNRDKTTINEIMIHQKRAKLSDSPPTLTVKDKDGQDKTLSVRQYTRLLGGNVSNNLTWTHHIESGDKAMIPQLRKQMGALNMLSKQIPQSSKLILSNGLIISRVCYLIQIWGSASKTQIKKVQRIVNAAARFVTGKNKRTSTSQLMIDCNWLHVHEQCTYQSLVSMWSTVHRQIPRQLFDQIQVDNQMYITTAPPRLLTVAHSYRWKTIAHWNQLEDDIRTQHSLPRFKNGLKKWIRSQRAVDPD